MEKKIYIVTSGEYSEYGINAVFTTKEKAVDYVEQHGTDYNIEEYNLDKEVVKETKLWLVEFEIESQEIKHASPTTYNIVKNKDTCEVTEYLSVKPYMVFYVEANTMDRAIKIARERFAAVKANEYIWLRLTRPYGINVYGTPKYETFYVKTNTFAKNDASYY